MTALENFFKDGLLWLADGRATKGASPYAHSLPQPTALKSAFSKKSSFSKNVAQFGLDAIDSQFPLGGLPTGAIHEWACTEDLFPCSILALLAGNVLRKTISHSPEQSAFVEHQSTSLPKKFAVWIGRDIWPTPYLLEQTMYITFQDGPRSVSKSLLPHCLFIDPPHEKLKLWAIELALRSPAVAAVVADCKKLTFATSRKFSLAARGSSALGLLIRDSKALQTPSASSSRWLIEPKVSASPSPCMQLKLIKCKGAQPKIISWVVELREGICAYEPDQQTLSLHLSSALGDQRSPVSAVSLQPGRQSLQPGRQSLQPGRRSGVAPAASQQKRQSAVR